MKKIDMDLLKNHLETNICPILIEDINSDMFEDAIILNSNCDLSDLNGHYEGINFMPPEWYQKLINNSNKNYSILLIDKINNISLKEQGKFNEILKYRKISTFDLPKNCRIIVTCTDLEHKPISEEVLSLLSYLQEGNYEC